MNQIELFTDAEAAKMLRLSKVSMWRRRQARQIGYRRDNGKIFYSREDLERVSITELSTRTYQSDGPGGVTAWRVRVTI